MVYRHSGKFMNVHLCSQEWDFPEKYCAPHVEDINIFEVDPPRIFHVLHWPLENPRFLLYKNSLFMSIKIVKNEQRKNIVKRVMQRI